MNGTLIIGLGNPGREYQRTRHNVGFLAVDSLTTRWGLSFTRQRARAEVAEGTVLGRRVTLAKPQTFMNSSGDAVRAVMRYGNLAPSNLLVIYDDMDLPFGRLRIRDKGSAGGHRGVQSIVDQLGTSDFARLRIGVGRPPLAVDPIDYVLSGFCASELVELKSIFDRVAEGVEVFMRDGVTAAMNVVNVTPNVVAPATLPESEPIR